MLGGKHDESQPVEVLMTHGEWEEMVTVPWGDFQTAAQGVRKSVLDLRGNERFLIYRLYELVPSGTPSLSVESGDAALRELPNQHPEGRLRWSAFDPDEPEDR